MNRPLGAFSVDVEDWYHSFLLRGQTTESASEGIVVRGTLAVLDWLARHQARATFFVLGEVIRNHPTLVRRILDEGHELGSHGMNHRPLWQSTPESFSLELAEFRSVAEEVLGEFPVVGFRAPTFSLDRSTAWAIDVLREHGYRYDSSVFPARVKMYGVANAPVGIYRPAPGDFTRHDPNGSLIEFPVAVHAWGPVRIPVAGGFYLRALPFGLFTALLDRVARERPFALYLHPRECIPEEVHLDLDPVNSFITYANLGLVPARVDALLGRWRFESMRTVLEQAGHLAPMTPATVPGPSGAR